VLNLRHFLEPVVPIRALESSPGVSSTLDRLAAETLGDGGMR